MTITVVTFKISDPVGVKEWTLSLDGSPQTMNGMQRQFSVTVGVEHTILYTYSGAPNGTINTELFHKGKILEERKPAKIPPGATSSYDRFIFTIAGDA
jgi:hypothetical protein